MTATEGWWPLAKPSTNFLQLWLARAYLLYRKQPNMASTYITKKQRKILIDSYMECADDMGLDDLDETQARLEKLSNPKLIQECVAFMPDCLEEI